MLDWDSLDPMNVKTLLAGKDSGWGGRKKMQGFKSFSHSLDECIFTLDGSVVICLSRSMLMWLTSNGKLIKKSSTKSDYFWCAYCLHLLVIWLIKNDVHTTVHIVVALTVGIRMTYKLVTVGWVSGRASSLWWGVDVVTCLEWGADCLHMDQLMPLHPKTPSSLASLKSRLVLPFWYHLPRLSWKRGQCDINITR